MMPEQEQTQTTGATNRRETMKERLQKQIDYHITKAHQLTELLREAETTPAVFDLAERIINL